jgi:hypothetical protein
VSVGISVRGSTMAKSALRRHHWQRVKHNRKRYWMWGFTYRYSGYLERVHDPERLNKLARTPCPCSCPGCANNRHTLGHKSMHDVRWDSKTGFEMRHKQRVYLEDFQEDLQ